MLLRIEEIAKGFGARSLFEGVGLTVNAGDRVGLVGPNGAGKTTLLRIVAGEEPADAGRCIQTRGARVARLRQEIDPTRDRVLFDEVASALGHLDAMERELRELEARMAEGGGDVAAELADRYDRLHHAFEHHGGFEREARVERVLAGLGFSEAQRRQELATFSGGWLMRAELAKLLLADPDVLLLDEPTNHLDLPSIQWFEEQIQAFRGAVVVISHDRTFLRRHTNRIAELAGGRFTVYEGGFDFYLTEREERRAQLLAEQKGQQRRIAETERFIERFRYKASKARQVQSRVKALDKLERVEVEPENRKRMRLRIPPVVRSGAVALRVEGLHKAYGEKRVYEGVDLEIARAERVALVGPNGAGKSTLLRILAGALAPDAGTRSLGHNVTLAHYAQHQLESLEPRNTVLAELERVAHVEDTPRLRGHLGAFLFSGDDVKKKVSVLSGGEKARLALAKLLLHPANLLVLDEPTNHLDVEAREVLEGALSEYGGTLVFISHDRTFINTLANRTVEVRDGALRSFPGNYDDYLRRVAPAAEPPARLASEAVAEAPAARPEAAGDARERNRLRRERSKAKERAERRLAKLEAEILERETAAEQLAWRLGDPEVARDGEQVRALEAERQALRDAIAAHYRDWERLAAEIEALAEAEA